MMMDCGRARRLCWPTGSPRELTPDLEAARQHVAGCPACQAFETAMGRLAEQIRDHAPRPDAPLDVRDRLFSAIAAARATAGDRGTRLRRNAVVIAAGVLLAAGLVTVQWQVRQSVETDPLSALADEHMRASMGGGIASSDTLAVAAWLRARLPFAIHVPAVPELQIQGARLCLMDGRRGGVIEYRTVSGESVSYYVLPEPNDWSAAPGPGELQQASRAGYHVVAWREPGLLHALVANLPESRLVEIAKLCMKDMLAAVPRLKERRNPAGGVS